ncbi:unnamed protein product [Owenia fusiformis]|uniref:Uncharacterized protein n=1 Tax=Owenia fusiformis TaxID=6347 RepID=A0A8J1XR24_OWEFU|nr:unnamed protein product [Owenia fusiformis]
MDQMTPRRWKKLRWYCLLFGIALFCYHSVFGSSDRVDRSTLKFKKDDSGRAPVEKCVSNATKWKGTEHGTKHILFSDKFSPAWVDVIRPLAAQGHALIIVTSHKNYDGTQEYDAYQELDNLINKGQLTIHTNENDQTLKQLDVILRKLNGRHDVVMHTMVDKGTDPLKTLMQNVIKDTCERHIQMLEVIKRYLPISLWIHINAVPSLEPTVTEYTQPEQFADECGVYLNFNNLSDVLIKSILMYSETYSRLYGLQVNKSYL